MLMPTLPQYPLLWQGRGTNLLGDYGSVMHMFYDFSHYAKALQISHIQGRHASPHHTHKTYPHARWEGVSEGRTVGLACPHCAATENL